MSIRPTQCTIEQQQPTQQDEKDRSDEAEQQTETDALFCLTVGRLTRFYGITNVTNGHDHSRSFAVDSCRALDAPWTVHTRLGATVHLIHLRAADHNESGWSRTHWPVRARRASSGA